MVVPLIADAPPADPEPLDRAVRRLVGQADPHGDAPEPVRAGRRGAAPRAGDRTDVPGYSWIVVTSATAVRVVAERVPRLPSGVRVAAVGEATARAARTAGWAVDLVPAESSAAALADALPQAQGTVLFPRSNLAAPTLVEGLRARAIDVDDVVAYRTVGTGSGPLALDRRPDAVLVTSGSVARELVRRMSPLDPHVVIACIGPGTADDARAAGLPVHVVSPSRSAEALLDAVVESLHPHVPEQEGTP